MQAVRLDQLPADEQHRWEQAARTLPRAALPADPAGWPATTDAVNRNGDRSNVACTRAAAEVPPDLGYPPLRDRFKMSSARLRG